MVAGKPCYIISQTLDGKPVFWNRSQSRGPLLHGSLLGWLYVSVERVLFHILNREGMRGRRHLGCRSRGGIRLRSGPRVSVGDCIPHERLMALDGLMLCAGHGSVSVDPVGSTSADLRSTWIEHESLILAQNERWRHA